MFRLTYLRQRIATAIRSLPPFGEIERFHRAHLLDVNRADPGHDFRKIFFNAMLCFGIVLLQLPEHARQIRPVAS